ncbi:hypothetical protein [Paracoccus salsus]|uniref:hypothetical protein n=1 Tax=Paracoccus salsus TaxID=2911061 RepID=UPI001F29F316|nr:hypothetical protein [Paracoccus salsus]MCF3974875.1 hypothetical protein [Paracoccus salsus]
MRRLLPLVLLLSACASGSPDMLGAARHEVRVDGLDFVVFAKGSEAETVRMGYLTRPQRARVPAAMARATALATGCRVIPGSMTTRIPGDTGVARFDLDCSI